MTRPLNYWIRNAGGAWALGLGAATLPYFVLRGWLNAATVLLGLAAVWHLARTGALRSLAGNRPLQWMVAALLSPLVATAMVQAVHGEFVARYFDSPVRFALAAALLVWLHSQRIDWIRVAGVALPLSLIFGAMLIYSPFGERYYWGGDQVRVASYFMDPLSLSQHSAMAGFMCLFLVAPGDSLRMRALKSLGLLVGVAVALSTGSRTGWVMMPLLALLWMFSTGRFRRPHQVLAGVAGLMAVALLVYAVAPPVRARVDLVATEVVAYASGQARDTSIGIRLSLYRASWAAFLERPWAGWGFATLPTPEQLPGTAGLWTKIMHTALVQNGSHNEWLQNMMRMGLLGLASRLMLYLIPLVLFARAALRSDDRQRRTAGYLGLVTVIGYLSAGLTSEVANLVYLASFYGLMMAAYGAVALPPRSPSASA